MNRIILLIVTFFSFASIYSAEPLVRFYLSDGSSKVYNINDIENFKFTTSPDTLQLQVFTNNNKTFYYPAQIIDSIKFALDSVKSQRIHLWHDGFKWDFALKTIDSILIYYTKYVAVTIGTQHWMYKNLNVDHYRNDEPIPEILDSVNWAREKTGGWCYYINEPTNGAIYGKLYNWYAVNDPRGLSPFGWHIPSDYEWKELEVYLGMTKSVADSTDYRGINEGGKLKSKGSIERGDGIWNGLNIGATNESGFTGLPSGVRYNIGKPLFNNIGHTSDWWTSSENNLSDAWFRFLSWDNAVIYRHFCNYAVGLSVRCVKD